MTAENFANFATTTLATASINATVLTFAVAAGQGALFPASNFVITMDTEVMLIASRSGDTFTIASGGRGYDGSTATTHTSGATIQNSIVRYTLKHVWSNVADTYHPEVPPVQDLPATSPSTFDNEFEGVGSWTLTPSPSGGTTFAVAPAGMPSHLVLNRVSGDNALYFAYIPFTYTGPCTITCKFSHATSFANGNNSSEGQINMFVCDQSNPTGGFDSGTRFRLDSVVRNSSPGPHYVRTGQDTSGTFGNIGANTNVPLGVPLYFRMTHNGSGTWTGYVGDGFTYWFLGSKTSFLTTPASLGFDFRTLFVPPFIPQLCAIDYIRVVQGTVLPPFGN